MTEPLIILAFTAGVLCWLLGGYRWKWIRRFLWPALCAGIVLMSGRNLLISTGVLAATVAANCLPYGERTPWPIKIAVFFLIPAPALVIHLWAFPAVLVGGALISWMAYATRKWEAVTHELFEATAGLVQAEAMITACLIAR